MLDNWSFLQSNLSVLAQLKVRWMSARIGARFESRSHETQGELLNCEISCTKNPQLHQDGGGWFLPQVTILISDKFSRLAMLSALLFLSCVNMVRQETFLMRKNGGSAVLIWVDASGNLWLRSCPQNCRGAHTNKALSYQMTMESQWNRKDTWSSSHWFRQSLVLWLQKYAPSLTLMNSSQNSLHPTNSNFPTFGLTVYVSSKPDPALEGGQQQNHFRRFPLATHNSRNPVISQRWNMF